MSPVTSWSAPSPRSGLRLAPTRYDDPVVQAMVEQVQQTYVERYGGRDDTPVDAAEFAPPRGGFVVARLDGEVAGMGGWRLRAAAARVPGDRPAEIKRMYVRPHLRGRGVARRVLAWIEETAREAGADWLVLETGDRQPEAVRLYLSAGFTPVPPFGLYAHEEGSIYLGRRLADGRDTPGQRSRSGPCGALG